MKNKVIEKMIKVVYDKSTVRVWRDITINAHDNNDDVKKVIDSNRDVTQETLADIIGKLNDVAAVEVLDNDGQGVVLYPDWK